MRIISAPVVPFAINYSGRVAGHLNDERGRSRPVRGKRNRFKIVSSQKARAGAVVRWKNTEGNNSSVERDRNVARSWTEKYHACGAILFSAGRSITALLRIKRKRRLIPWRLKRSNRAAIFERLETRRFIHDILDSTV